MGLNLNILNRGLIGADTAALGFQGGRQQRIASNAETENAIRQLQFKLALEAAARKQTQSNADRTYQREVNAGTETARHHKAMEAKTPAPVAGITPPRQTYALSDEGISQAEKRAKALAAIRAHTPAGRAASAGSAPIGVSAGDARRETMANKFADMYIEAAGGDGQKAMEMVEHSPAEKLKARALGLTEAHWKAAYLRHQERLKGAAGSITFSKQ